MKSKISQARHRVTSGVGGRIVNGYDNMPVYRLGDLPAGARYRTSDAVRIRGFNTSDTSPKYDKNLTTEMQGEQSLSSYSAESTAKMIIIMKMWFENIINIVFLQL